MHDGAAVRLWWTFFFYPLFSLSSPYQNIKVSCDFFVSNLVIVFLIAICFIFYFFIDSFISSRISWFHLISISNLVFILLIDFFFIFIIEFCFLFHPSSFVFHFLNPVPFFLLPFILFWILFLIVFVFSISSLAILLIENFASLYFRSFLLWGYSRVHDWGQRFQRLVRVDFGFLGHFLKLIFLI